MCRNEQHTTGCVSSFTCGVGSRALTRSFLANIFLTLGCFGCQAPDRPLEVLQGISGVARTENNLLIADDEASGAYFRFRVPEKAPSVFELWPLARVDLPGASLVLDAESIAVLADGRPVVLSERLRGLVGSEGLVVEYPKAFSEFGNRGLEGLAVAALPGRGSRLAVLWEGGYPADEGTANYLLPPGPEGAFLPVVLIHDLDEGERRVKLSSHSVETVYLSVPNPGPAEGDDQRFRAPDLVWNAPDPSRGVDESEFIVLLSSENASYPKHYKHRWLQRFDREGQPVGNPIDLDRLSPAYLNGVNWEGLDWFDYPTSLIVVCEQSPAGPGAAMIVELPHDWLERSPLRSGTPTVP